MKPTTLINGREAVIEYRQSRSQQKEEAKLYTDKAMNTLRLLLEGDRDRKHEKGIATLRTFTTMEGMKILDDERVSNAIVQLRKVIPRSGLLTFRYLNEKKWRYALINDSNIIDFADKLLVEIRKNL